MGAGPVHAQAVGGGGATQPDTGEVTDITVTFPGSGAPASATGAVDKPVTFTATSSAGTQQPNTAAGWHVVGPAIYKWSTDTTYPTVTFSPPDAAQTTVTVPYTSPGKYTVTLFCRVSYPVMNGDGLPGEIFGTGKAPITIYVIGGPIKGDKDEYFFCDGGDLDSVATLSAAPGQPAGTTYAWSISGSAIYCDGYGTPTTPTGATAQYRGTLPGSQKVGDVTANVTYSLNGVSAKSSPDFHITTHVPATFVPLTNGTTGPTPLLPPDPNSYGFDGQKLHFQVLDGVGQPVQNAYWDEIWDDSKATGGGGKPAEIGHSLDAQGVDTDFFHVYGRSCPTDPSGDLLIANLTHTYYVTNIGQTGGGIGCPVKTYTGVKYFTYKMTGNGF